MKIYPSTQILLTLLVGCLLFPLSSPAPLTAYLKIEDIKGESKAADHENAIEIEDMQWEIEREESLSGGGAGKVNFGKLSLIKRLDRASPLLMEACAIGSIIPEAVLTVRRDGGDDPLDYLIITMEDVVINSLKLNQAGGDDRPSETMELSFGKIEVSYVPQDPDTGRPQTPVDFRFDITGNTGG